MDRFFFSSFFFFFFVVLGVVALMLLLLVLLRAATAGNHGRERPPDPVHRGPREGHPSPVHPHEAAAAHHGALLHRGYQLSQGVARPFLVFCPPPSHALGKVVIAY